MAEKTAYLRALRFRFLTRYYDWLVERGLGERRLKRALVSEMGLIPGHRVLDVGCGTGTLMLAIKRQVPQTLVFGIDLDPDMIDLLRRKFRAASLPALSLRASAAALPFSKHSFDRVCSSLLLHHLAPWTKRACLGEIRRVLKEGGSFHLMDWDLPANPLMRAAFFSVRLFDGLASTRDHVRGGLQPLLREAGFSKVCKTGTNNTVFGSLSRFRAVSPPSSSQFPCQQIR